VKDEWGVGAVPPPTGVSANVKSPIGSAIIYGFNKPAAAVAPYQQTPPKKSVSASVTITPEPDPKARIRGNPETSLPPVRNESDDFSFKVTTSMNKTKLSSTYSSAGVNIARMYKAAGYTNPPAAAKRSSSTFLNK